MTVSPHSQRALLQQELISFMNEGYQLPVKAMLELPEQAPADLDELRALSVRLRLQEAAVQHHYRGTESSAAHHVKQRSEKQGQITELAQELSRIDAELAAPAPIAPVRQGLQRIGIGAGPFRAAKKQYDHDSAAYRDLGPSRERVEASLSKAQDQLPVTQGRAAEAEQRLEQLNQAKERIAQLGGACQTPAVQERVQEMSALITKALDHHTERARQHERVVQDLMSGDFNGFDRAAADAGDAHHRSVTSQINTELTSAASSSLGLDLAPELPGPDQTQSLGR